ncbi:MAG: WD40/YVTN/BNR-like repeat-containing protein [Candidatus Acidiferrales bacterium]
MAHDDRDRNFEKALARHLRSSAPSGVEANALSGAPLESCPDPETLAAYHEKALSSGELILWKEHVVACSRCQFVLAQLAATEKITLDASPAEDPLFSSERAPSRKQRSLDSQSIGSERRSPSWRWVLLIPAGAIAAGLVAWVSLQQPKPLQVSPSSPVEVAENRSTPPLDSSSKPSLVAPAERKEKDQPAAPSAGAAAGGALPDRDAVAKELHKQTQAAQQTPHAYTTKTAPGPALSMQRQEQQQRHASRMVAGSLGGRIVDQKKLDAQAPARISENAKSVAAPPAPMPPPPSEPTFLDQGAMATPSPSRVSPASPAPSSNVAVPKEKSANADAISSMSETVEVSSEPQTPARAKAMMLAGALQNPHVFVAPDGKHLWRVGPAGSLVTSKDRGAKWTLQTSGVNTDLLAGFAVSAKVCWVVGNSGTILRTTDGGAHWTKLDSPVTNDLTGVRATDALHASIWFVADLQTGLVKTYQTTDGGATWSAAPGQ